MIDWRAPHSEEFIEENIEFVDWSDISAYQNLTEAFIEKYADKVDWPNISRNQKLSEAFIEKFASLVDWDMIFSYQKLSESFIAKHASAKLWIWASAFQTLSEEFVEENKYFLCWPFIQMHQKLSPAFRLAHNIQVPKNNWLYKSTAFKKKAVQDTGLYECHKDYFIACKAIRADRYSIFNFQYKYEKGGVYETHADYTDNEDSFGFGAGSEESAFSYGISSGEGYCELVRVKVYYNDVARVVHNGDKIRACKIEVLD